MSMKAVRLLIVILSWFVVGLPFIGCQQQATFHTTDTPQVDSCTAVPAPGGVDITCPNGTSSFLASGAVGGTGAVGAIGPRGLPGIDASITLVQFCQSCIASYPSVFPEIGFCISDNLYATYSENDGFSALITPGNYVSNGIGCSCNFTVSGNCQITN